jgi:hypothetical protein
MNVRRIVIIIEHPDDNSEEDGNDGHYVLFLPCQCGVDRLFALAMDATAAA